MTEPELRLHVRVSSVLAWDGIRRTRHAYRDLSGLLAMAVCATNNRLTCELRQDDPDVPLCPLCKVFLAATELDHGDASDWKDG